MAKSLWICAFWFRDFRLLLTDCTMSEEVEVEIIVSSDVDGQEPAAEEQDKSLDVGQVPQQLR